MPGGNAGYANTVPGRGVAPGTAFAQSAGQFRPPDRNTAMARTRPTDAERPRRRPSDYEPDDVPERGRPNPLLWVGIAVGAVAGLGAVGGAAWWALRSKPAPAPVAVVVPPKSGEQQTNPAPAKKDEPPRLTPKHSVVAKVGGIDRMFLSADGRRVAVGHEALEGLGNIEVWDISATPVKVRAVVGDLRAFAPDGKHLIRRGKAFATEVVNADTGATVAQLKGDEGSNRNLHFTDPDRIVSLRRSEHLPGGKGGRLIVTRYDARTGQAAGSFEIPGPTTADVGGLTAGGRELVVGWEKTERIEVWDVAGGKLVRGVALQLPAGATPGWDRFQVSPDGKRVAALRYNSRFTVFDAATGAAIGTATEQSTELVFLPGRERVLSSEYIQYPLSPGRGFRARALPGFGVVADLPGANVNALSADGRVLATSAGSSSAFTVWDVTAIP